MDRNRIKSISRKGIKLNWQERIDAAKERGFFTTLDKADSTRWNTCAVGEHRGSYPENEKYKGWGDKYDGMPIQEIALYSLGSQFHMQVLSHHFGLAQETYNAIQK